MLYILFVYVMYLVCNSIICVLYFVPCEGIYELKLCNFFSSKNQNPGNKYTKPLENVLKYLRCMRLMFVLNNLIIEQLTCTKFQTHMTIILLNL